ncbi:MAG: LptF/LptG family permease [Chitinophagaceae bacterium]|nr:LptF/LptG family permease [Chitinophagaceae bacterium]
MTKLDGYILRKFFKTFVFCLLMFTLIAVAVDSSEKTDDFVRTGLGTSEIITQYYTGFVPFIWGFLFPLIVFISVIFFTSRMAFRSEIIAIIASGVTYNRWLRPYLFGGALITIIFWFGNQYGIPRANEIRARFESKYLGKYDPEKNFASPYYYLRIDTDTYVGIKFYDTASKAAGNFFLERVRKNQVIYNLRAETIRWDSVKKNWFLTNVVERTINNNKEAIRHLPQMNMNFNFKPEELRRDYYLKDKLTTPQLSKYIQVEELRGTEGLNTFKVEKYRRTSIAASVFILTLIGALIAGRKIRGGSGLHLAIGIAISAIFILSDRFSTVFAVKGDFPPLLAAWMPNIVFSFVAIYLYIKAPK